MYYLKAKILVVTFLVSVCYVGTSQSQTFAVQSAGDFGASHPSYPPANAVDGDISFGSRWAANLVDGGGSVNLYVDLGSVQRIDDIGVAWGRGNQRSYTFEVRARSGTSGSWTKVFSGQSSGNTTGVEQYNVTDIDARQVRVKVFSNSAGTSWVDITEFEVYGTSGPSGGNNGGGGNTAAAVPGRIEAEDFVSFSDTTSANQGGAYRNTAVDLQGCLDSGCGFNVGWTVTGEWLQYEIDVNAAGTYQAEVRLASPNSGRDFSIAIDGSNVTGSVTVDNTGGWQNWYSETVNLGNLSAGQHTLRFNIVDGGFNINWIDIKTSGGGGGGQFGLDPSAQPWENFDLIDAWALDTPAPRPDNSCKAERTDEDEWNSLSNASKQFIFTHTDGGMRFVTRIDGETTSDSCSSGFVRSELREMLRAGDTSISTTGVNKNNWKLGYQPGSASNWGGENGRMDATLRVNKVTTSGSSSQVGRVIIGQIHAAGDEPLRLYYRKRVGQSKGCIYFAHEIRDSDDVDFFMIGNESCTSGPSNGIALNELFSYTIINNNEDITVIIRRGDRDGPVIAQETIDMNTLNSGYDRSDEWMYFKAGAYTQNNSGNGSDGDIVTFYRLSKSHD